MQLSGHPHDQAVAAALDTARRYGKRYADGGFAEWKKTYAPNDSGEDYDLRAAFMAGLKPDANGHWPDTYKKPNHPTFSDESVYSQRDPSLPAGRWYGESFIPPDLYAEGGETDEGESWSPDDDATQPEVTPKPTPTFEEGVRAALGRKPAEVSPTGPYRPELRTSPDPSLRQRLARKVAGEDSSPYRRRLASELLGSTGTGDSGLGLVDATPLGMGLAADEEARKGHMAEAAASLIPGVKVGRGLGKAAMAAAEHAAPSGSPEWFNNEFANVLKGEKPSPQFNEALGQMHEAHAPAPQAEAPHEGSWTPDWMPEPAASRLDRPLNTEQFEYHGAQKGSNPGGVYRDPNTNDNWYIKQPQSGDHANNEILAARLYELAGVRVPEIRPTMIDGKPAIASKMLDGTIAGKYQLQPWVKNEIGKDMPVDAWLANWDAVGTGKDNVIFDNITGHPYRIDMGGALRYRAQGAPKGDKFGHEVPELQTFLDPKINKDAADIFGGIDKNLTFDAVKRLDQIEPGQIAAVIDKWGPRDQAEKMELLDTLLARKQAVVDDFYKSQQTNLPKPGGKPFDINGHATELVKLASYSPEEALQIKNGLSPADKKAVNKALWAMTKKADPETKEVINNLYSGKVKAKALASGLSDKEYLASLKAKKEAYKGSKEKSDAEYAKEQAEYEANMAGKELHESEINSGGYDSSFAAENDKKINGSFKSEPGTKERFEEVARPIKDWRSWAPPEYEPEKRIPRPKGPFTLPNAVAPPEALEAAGYNLKVPVYKGGYDTWHGELPDPAVKWDEKAWFAAHHPTVAAAYGKVHAYFAKPKKVIELNWPEYTGYYHYNGINMDKAIKLAREQDADMLILHNMVDLSGHKWNAEPHTQFAILKTEGVRHIEAKFDPSQFHLRHSHAGLVGGGLFTYGAMHKDNEDRGMKKGGRAPSKMAGGGFNPTKWIPRPPNLERAGLRAPAAASLRPAAPVKPAPSGMIHSAIPGRTDKIGMNVKGGSYILPADVVSGIGEGNSMAGAAALNSLLGQGPYGSKKIALNTPKVNFGKPMRMPMRMPSPAPMKMPRAAEGGAEDGGDRVPIIAAGGEFVISPEVVRRIGGGDMKHGHDILDALVLHLRKKTIHEMRNLKGPKR